MYMTTNIISTSRVFPLLAVYTKPTHFNLATTCNYLHCLKKIIATILFLCISDNSDLSKVQDTSLLSRLSLNHENSVN